MVRLCDRHCGHRSTGGLAAGGASFRGLTLTALAGIGLYMFCSRWRRGDRAGAAVQAPMDNLTTVTSRDVLWN